MRAQSLKSAIKGMVPGGEHLLAMIPDGYGKVLGSRRVRCLTPDDLVLIAQAWETWPFKPDEAEWGGHSWTDEDIQLRKASRKPV